MKPTDSFVRAGMAAIALALASAPLRAATPEWAGAVSVFSARDSWVEAAAPADSSASTQGGDAPSGNTAGSVASEQPASPVPEPDVWAMLASGFGLIIFMARRRLTTD